MTSVKLASRPLQCLRQQQSSCTLRDNVRVFSTTARTCEDVTEVKTPNYMTKVLEPHLVHTPRLERRLVRTKGLTPVGSRRRRAVLQAKQQIPFEQLPFQCFQEARKVLQEDRQEKLEQIDHERAKIQRLRAAATAPQNEGHKERRLKSMESYLEELKVFADVNDPLVKKRFEDGLGDMNKPIYRYLADRQWREYRRKLVMQRITQMNVVPDVLPTLDATASVEISFGRQKVESGEFVNSSLSEQPARLDIQLYQKGERYVTIAVVNPDVPDVAKDGFDYRCHFLACNIKVSPTTPRVLLRLLSEQSQVLLPWLPAYVQKGAPYNRMSVFVLEQPEGEIDVGAARSRVRIDGFILRSFADRHALKPIGANLFRSQWDENTAEVMQRAGISGHDVMFKRMRVEPLPYKKLPGSRYR